MADVAHEIEREVAKEAAKENKGYRRRKQLPQGNPRYRSAPADKENGWKGLHRGLPWSRWLEAAVLTHDVRRRELGGVHMGFAATGLGYLECFITVHARQLYCPEREVRRGKDATHAFDARVRSVAWLAA